MTATPRNSAAAHYDLGNALYRQGKHAEAEASYRRAVEINPDYAAAHCNLGVVLAAQRKLEEAEASYRRALAIEPNSATAYSNLGNTLKELGRLSEAANCCRQALEIKPDYALAHNNLGVILKELGRRTEAEASYRRALQLNPGYAEAHNNLGVVLADMGRARAAELSYRRALELRPDFYEAHSNLGNALKELARLTEAEASYRRSLELNPGYAEAHNNLAVILKDMGRLTESEASCRRAMELRPSFALAHSNLLFALNYAACHHLSYHLEEAVRYGRMVAGKVKKPFSAWRCQPHPERLRVGLVSGDLRRHPVGYFLESVLAQLDPNRIQLVAYATHVKDDELTARIKPCFSTWKSLAGQSDEAAARMIHADGVHLLLDLAGHTAKNRLPVFAWKPAPVQASWLGYFATTGVGEMDYLLGDPYVTPAEENGHFTETIWRLPESYLCFTPPDIALEVGPLPARSAGHITFGSFNNLTKLNDAVLALWSRVLHAVPSAHLLLKTKQLGDPDVRDTICRRFAARGVAPERLLLEGGSPRAGLLASYHRVDIALDPFPYPGGTTSVEGLWMGVPMLTRRGDRFLSHLGESLAHNAGLPDWIAADDDDYVAKAAAHASNLDCLASLRAGLRQQVLASPLFDAPRFARNLEAAWWGMWQSCRLNCIIGSESKPPEGKTCP